MEITAPQRYQVKVFPEGDAAIEFADVVRIFHRWIRDDVLDELLIDVADYKHVPGGPGILLVGFASDYLYGDSGGRRGLSYSCKRTGKIGLAESLLGSMRRIATAALLLQSASELEATVSFDPRHIEITFLDGLAVQNTEDDFRRVVGQIESALQGVGAGASAVISRIPDDSRRPLRIRVLLGEGAAIQDLANAGSPRREATP